MKNCLFILTFFSQYILFSQQYQGLVVDANQMPIPYAQVNFVDFEYIVVADSTGAWQTSNLPEGTVKVKVSASGFEAMIKDIILKQGHQITLVLPNLSIDLDGVEVVGRGELERESVAHVSSHSYADLNAVPSTTMGEALANVPGVSLTGIGVGIGKPVVRGLSGSSVVTYVNGLRIQNQQWGADHGLPITSLGIGRVDVIKGPASLLYGADALGGVMYFVDEVYEQKNTYSAFLSSKYEHNSLGANVQGGYKWHKDKLRFNLYGGYGNFADYTLPNGMQALNSRFRQGAGKFALGYSHKKWLVNIRYNFNQSRIGLPGHTHDENPDPSSFETVNQSRKENVPAQRVQNHFASIDQKFFLGKQQIHITLGNTYNALKEHEEKFSRPDIIMNLNNSLYNAKWKYHLTENFKFILGSQGMLQYMRNGESAIEVLIPNANTLDVGAYGLAVYTHQKWRFQGGGRFDNRAITLVEGSDEPETSKSYSGLNYALGVAREGKVFNTQLNVSSGFRAPNTSELFSDGVHHGSFRYEIGAADLKTENAIQFDLNIELKGKHVIWIVNPFYNRIQDYIFLAQSSEVIDGFPVYRYSQTDFAQLYGLETGIHYHPHFAKWIHLESNLSTIFAEDAQRQALPLIPQTNVNTTFRLEFEMKRRFKITDVVLQHLFYFKQNRIGLFETESPAYHLVNFSLNMRYDVAQPLLFSVGVRNILNTPYINHLSGLKNLGIYSPGYNAFVSLRYEFANQIKNK